MNFREMKNTKYYNQIIADTKGYKNGLSFGLFGKYCLRKCL